MTVNSDGAGAQGALFGDDETNDHDTNHANHASDTGDTNGAGADAPAGASPSGGAAARTNGPADDAASNGHTVVVIDGHALAYRSYYAIRDLTNSKGRPVNAVYGFVRSLLRILAEEGEHDATVVAFDAPAKTFRHEQYEDYKAGRAPTPDDLPPQIRTIKRLVDLLGLFRIEVPGLEADDLMGTIAARCSERGYGVELVTSDRDAYQLIGERVCVRGLDRKDTKRAEDIVEKYGVTVEQWVDYRALIGDSSDNIPGARGIGPVSARKLLQRYGDLDAILADLDAVEPTSYRDKIRASLDDVKFSRELSRIVTDADIDIDPRDWAAREMQRDALAELLRDLEFGSVLRELDLTESVEYDEGEWTELAADEGPWMVGVVLSSERVTEAELVGLAVAAGGRVAVAPDDGARRAFLERSGRVDGADAKALVVHALCATEGASGLEPGDDPLLMAYVLDPSSADAETVARRYGGGEWGEDAAARAAATAELLRALGERLEGRRRTLYEEIERPLQIVLARMEARGVAVDGAQLEAQSAAMADTLAELEAGVREVAGDRELNVNSRDQLAALLYDKLGLQAGRKTSTGKRSTAVSVLEGLRGEHEVVDMILRYRELAKLKSTYLDPLPRLIDPRSGRIHTTFNQTVAATGRLSSVNPNLQNIPVRSELGREIRRAFVAGAGMTLLVADYSQIELRILAHVAGEEALIEVFRSGEDIHRRTAAEIFEVAPDAVSGDQRRVAKVINFGVLYGMSAHRLTRELGIEYDEADRFISRYFERYPAVQKYIDRTLAFCREHGWVETLLGRRRMIPDINAKNRNAREYAERTAYNLPIQGTQADIMKIAMLRLAEALEPHGAHLTLQVHDEVVVEAPAGSEGEVAPLVRDTMVDAFDLDVPLVAEVGAGSNWLEAK